MNDFASRSKDLVSLQMLAEVAEPTAYDKVMLGALLMRYSTIPASSLISSLLSELGS